jgi:cytochrome c oxidase subunit II
MSAIEPPSERIWWKQPLDRLEGTWIVIALVWCLIMFFMMPYWHVFGQQNYKGEAYRVLPQKYVEKVGEMVDAYTVRHETERQIPVVAPPAGSDVYLLARLWEWYPVLELKKGETYRLHISSATGSTGSRSSPSTSTCRCCPATTWS